MIIIVDGYNVLKQVHYAGEISQADRTHFIATLRLYGKRKKHTIILVFDGGGYEWPFKEVFPGITVVYSGYQESADDYIKELLQEKRSLDVLVVTSDYDVNTYAQDLNIPSIESVAFWSLVMSAVQPSKEKGPSAKSPLIKLTNTVNQELDDLMSQVVGEFVVEHRQSASRWAEPKGKKSSKHEKRLHAILKKL